MAITFKLKYGYPLSYSYIDLTDVDHGNIDYVPQAPAENADEITESGKWRVYGSSLANLVTAVAAIENVFRRAAAYDADHIGANQVYLTAMLDGATTWESPIYEGRVELPETIFKADWANFSTEITIIWRRAPWWELFGSVDISNTNGSSNYVQIYNCNDGSGSSPNKKENFVDIAADQIGGDLPAPAIILMRSVTNPTNVDDVLICHNANALPATLVYQAEVGTVADTTDATRSGGYYKTVAVPAGGTGYDVETGSVNLADLSMGAWLRYILSAKFTGTVKAKPYIKVNTIKYYGPASNITNAGTYFMLFDLGMVRLPESATGRLSYGYFDTVAVGINLYHASGLNVSVDYFQYSPIDSFLRAKMDALINLGTTDIRIDSQTGIAGGIKRADGKLTTLGTLHNGIYLLPGLAQRLVFKFKGGDDDNMATETSVKIYCYERKKTL